MPIKGSWAVKYLPFAWSTFQLILLASVWGIGEAWIGKQSSTVTVTSVDEDVNPFREFNVWLNSFFFSKALMAKAEEKFGQLIGHIIFTYVRDLVAGFIVYYAVNLPWHWYIYIRHGNHFFPEEGSQPKWEVIWDQMLLAQCSLFVYAMLPVTSQLLIEYGYTRVYYSMSDVGGWQWYAAYMAAYLLFVEFGIYWVHRTLHTNKFLYKHVHALHHKYNKPTTLSPWASIAFNPVDGVAQASPYVAGLFLIPCHYFTHLAMLFFTGVWATNIHDTLHGNTEPVMGSKYHLVHHTHYHYNFGQFFILFDWLYGTLKRPEDIKKAKAALKKTN
uniref:Fatty acid hydroxylase domain-containing protein n=1 Tax=Fibrocapsa japonica TaxID=94617 RepID=A0A7S2UWH0_9STRA